MQPEPAQLLVIDEDDSTHAIIPILEQCGYNLTVLTDVSTIWNYAHTEFDVIIRGSTAYQSNKPLFVNIFRNTPVIVATNDNDTEAVIKCLELGATDYICPPFHPTLIKVGIKGLAHESPRRHCYREHRRLALSRESLSRHSHYSPIKKRE